METVKRIVAPIAGATLGFITDNRRGAQRGYKFGKFLTQKRMPPVRRTYDKPRRKPYSKPTGKGTRRSVSKKRKYKRKRYNRGLSRENSKKVKSIVKRTLACDFNHGIYEKNVASVFSPVVAQNGQAIITKSMRAGGNVSPFTEFAMGFTPFNIKRLLDAASVLYNGKPRAVNIEASDKNFNLKSFTTTFNYCSYKLTLRNQTNVIYDVEMIEFVRKANSDVSVLDEWTKSVESLDWIEQTSLPMAYGMRPQMIEKMKTLYNISSSHFVFYPGDEKKIFKKFEGCVDFSKYVDDTAASLKSYARKIGSEIMFIMKPKLNIAHDENSTLLSYVGRGTAFEDARSAVLVETNEVFKIQQPDETEPANEGTKRGLLNSFQAYPLTGLKVSQYSRTTPITQYYNVVP